MFYGKTLKLKIEKQNQDIEVLLRKVNLLDKKVEELMDNLISLSRIIDHCVDGEITYENVFSSIWSHETYVLIYKDKREYKFNGISLSNPVFKTLSDKLLDVYSDEGAHYIFDLSSEKIIQY